MTYAGRSDFLAGPCSKPMKKTDSEMEQWVLRKLKSLEDFGSAEICVQCHEGVVRLCGSVPSDANKLAVELAVVQIPGLAGIVNDLKIDSYEMSETSATLTSSQKFITVPLSPRKRIAHRSVRVATP